MLTLLARIPKNFYYQNAQFIHLLPLSASNYRGGGSVYLVKIGVTVLLLVHMMAEQEQGRES